MDCDEALDRIADRLGRDDTDDAALDVHLAACTDCAAVAHDAAHGRELVVADDLSGDDAPPVDRAALRAALVSVVGNVEAASPSSRSIRGASLRTFLRVAAVLLAAVGVLALFDSRLRVESGRLQIEFALPGAAAAPQPVAPRPGPAELDAAIVRRVRHELADTDAGSPVRRAVDAELRPHLEELATWFVDTDRRRREDLEFLAAWLERRREADAATLARQLLDTRSELQDTREMQERMLEVIPPRFEIR